MRTPHTEPQPPSPAHDTKENTDPSAHTNQRIGDVSPSVPALWISGETPRVRSDPLVQHHNNSTASRNSDDTTNDSDTLDDGWTPTEIMSPCSLQDTPIGRALDFPVVLDAAQADLEDTNLPAGAGADGEDVKARDTQAESATPHEQSSAGLIQVDDDSARRRCTAEPELASTAEDRGESHADASKPQVSGEPNFFTPRRARSAAESKAAKVALNEAHATLAKFAGPTVSADQASTNCYDQGEGLHVSAENLPALEESDLACVQKEEQQEREAQANVYDVDSQRLLAHSRHRHAEELEQQLKAQARHAEEIQHALQRMTEENADLRLKLCKQAGDSQNEGAPAEAWEPLFASQNARPMLVSQSCCYTYAAREGAVVALRKRRGEDECGSEGGTISFRSSS